MSRRDGQQQGLDLASMDSYRASGAAGGLNAGGRGPAGRGQSTTRTTSSRSAPGDSSPPSTPGHAPTINQDLLRSPSAAFSPHAQRRSAEAAEPVAPQASIPTDASQDTPTIDSKPPSASDKQAHFGGMTRAAYGAIVAGATGDADTRARRASEAYIGLLGIKPTEMDAEQQAELHNIKDYMKDSRDADPEFRKHADAASEDSKASVDRFWTDMRRYMRIDVDLNVKNLAASRGFREQSSADGTTVFNGKVGDVSEDTGRLLVAKFVQQNGPGSNMRFDMGRSRHNAGRKQALAAVRAATAAGVHISVFKDGKCVNARPNSGLEKADVAYSKMKMSDEFYQAIRINHAQSKAMQALGGVGCDRADLIRATFHELSEQATSRKGQPADAAAYINALSASDRLALLTGEYTAGATLGATEMKVEAGAADNIPRLVDVVGGPEKMGTELAEIRSLVNKKMKGKRAKLMPTEDGNPVVEAGAGALYRINQNLPGFMHVDTDGDNARRRTWGLTGMDHETQARGAVAKAAWDFLKSDRCHSKAEADAAVKVLFSNIDLSATKAGRLGFGKEKAYTAEQALVAAVSGPYAKVLAREAQANSPQTPTGSDGRPDPNSPAADPLETKADAAPDSGPDEPEEKAGLDDVVSVGSVEEEVVNLAIARVGSILDAVKSGESSVTPAGARPCAVEALAGGPGMVADQHIEEGRGLAM